jgi:hypothetical protein
MTYRTVWVCNLFDRIQEYCQKPKYLLNVWGKGVPFDTCTRSFTGLFCMSRSLGLKKSNNKNVTKKSVTATLPPTKNKIFVFE